MKATLNHFMMALLLATWIFNPDLSSADNSVTIPFNPSKGFIGYVPDEIVIQFKEKTSKKLNLNAIGRTKTGLPAIDNVGERFKATRIRRQFPESQQRQLNGRKIDLSGWHKVKFTEHVEIQDVLNAYKALPQVVDAQPIGIHSVDATPNDSNYSSQWHLNQSNDYDMDAPETWENLKEGLDAGRIELEDVIVAVLDSGVRYFHKDLGGSGASYPNPTNVDGNMWINSLEKNGTTDVDDDGNGFVDDWIGWDFVNDDSDCYDREDCSTTDNDPRDFNGHGTHCAGNVAAITNNDYATSSPAGGWGSGSQQTGGNGIKIMALRIGRSDSDGGGVVRMDYAAEALYYAADNGAKIASCSWGSSNTGGIDAAIDYFVSNGGLIFKAAGNDNCEFSWRCTDYMCERADVVCVAATDQDDCKASFSNFGTEVDISAPGVDIRSLYHVHTNPSADYTATASGTSMATPLVASTATLIWAQNPTWTAGQVTTKLLNSADSIDSLSCNSSYSGKLGSGRVNLYQATYVDTDSDGVDDWSDGCPSDPAKTEPGTCGCGIEDIDTDADALLDCEEEDYGTDPEIADTDGDGLKDGGEIDIGTDPLDEDSDDDGYSDGEEAEAGTDPLASDSYPIAMAVGASGPLSLFATTILLLGLGLSARARRRHNVNKLKTGQITPKTEAVPVGRTT